MLLLLLSFVAGTLTILGPCILPVVPFVFTRVDRPFLQNGLPMLVGLAFSFAVVGTLASVGGSWVVEANEAARQVALLVLALVGVSLLVPRLASRWMRPLVSAGERLAESAQRAGARRGNSILQSFLLGAATGLLWAPCAGPVLGLVLTAAVLHGVTPYTAGLLAAYAAGAATSLALVLWAGGRAFALLRRSMGAVEVLRRAIGAAVLLGVGTIALGLDTGLLARLSGSSGATRLEQHLLERFSPQRLPHPGASLIPDPAAFEPDALLRTGLAKPAAPLPVEGMLPDLEGATTWLNSPPLTREALKGKVVLVDFWTFACINCQHALPYVRAWHEKYKDQGLVVIGVHSPEFAFERRIENVRRAARDLGLGFPIAVDNNFAIWRSFSNQYWPAHYFVDAQGRIRFHHFGEGEYERSEQVIRQLLEEARGGQPPAPAGRRS
ncbi:cytochrome c biogenesis protein DipZ [Ramlibacter sp. AN1133]|uniref:cytochrome c biogenesis protein DipZ n=1 Tax=Ramlibacter sp. AN1133 TaxID=3133429 RepID=UPI0030BF2DC8